MEIWQHILKDPERGARELVAVYQDRIYTVALMMCRDEKSAEDLMFRTFARAVEKISSFRPNTNFYNWLYTILINFRRMDLRKANGERLVFTEETPEAPICDTPFSELVRKADRAAIRSAVAELSEPLKEVVLLRYFEGMSMDDIAATLSLPSGTVKSRLNYAKSVLLRRLSAQFGKDGQNG